MAHPTNEFDGQGPRHERYDIVRFYANSHHRDHQKVVNSFTTEAEAQEYCQREDTHEVASNGDVVWFDGYRQRYS